MKLHAWNAIEEEPLNPRLTRRAIHAENLTVARMALSKGALVPPHSHAHEQVSMVERGALRFLVDGREQVVRAGQALVLAPHETHAVEALEDSLVLDLFSPAREDWISGDDAYLRR